MKPENHHTFKAMTIKNARYLLIWAAALLFTGCMSSKKIVYFQESEAVKLQETLTNFQPQIQQGDFANNKKSINPSSEVSYLKYSQTPMLPTLQSTITNPANLIENNAADGWIRGGLPSRELARDKDYNN